MTTPDDLVTRLRAGSRERRATRARGPELRSVEDVSGPGGLPLRWYRPADGDRPLLVFLHGGGFVLGDLDTHDRVCRRIALTCDLDVLAVEYRLAPEHPYPAGVEDAVAVLRGSRPAAVAGDSAGGFLAIAACMALRDEGAQLPSVQALFCPNTDLTLAGPSVIEKGTGHGLDAETLAVFVESFVPDPAARRAASPLHADNFADLPAALVVTAEHDPLRDEGDAYARRLALAGVPVRHRCEPGLEHGFIQNDDPTAEAAQNRIFADLRDLVPR
jgi:acetyl esterase